MLPLCTLPPARPHKKIEIPCDQVVYSELRITGCIFQVASYELRVVSHVLQVAESFTPPTRATILLLRNDPFL
jgi:hypothetical protein